MDLITIILIVGSLVNGMLLTLVLRRAQEACEQAVTCRAELHLMSGPLTQAIAALPKKRKPRAKTEVPGEASHQALTDGALARGMHNERK